LTVCREGQYSIRINKQYRICFCWDDDQPNPTDVEVGCQKDDADKVCRVIAKITAAD
jgi:plasmid maintenance system killer protein